MFSLHLKQNESYYLTSILTVSTTETPCPLTALFTNHPFASALSTAPHQASINHLVSGSVIMNKVKFCPWGLQI